jgi:hypothetical protein
VIIGSDNSFETNEKSKHKSIAGNKLQIRSKNNALIHFNGLKCNKIKRLKRNHD